MAKIYLSAAAHGADNPTKCSQKCGENTHCNAYMDIVEGRLKALGFEIKQTAMTCLYDELFFHDNAEDCAWFHNGGMALLAEETVQALCEICGVAYKPEVKEEPKKEVPVAPAAPAAKPAPKAGDVVKLTKGKLYTSARGTVSVTRAGTFYLYDGVAVNGRYRVTNVKSRVGKTPLWLNVSGWVEM